MSITYSDAAAEAFALGLSVTRIVETIEIYNSSVGSRYYVNAPDALTATLETLETVTFQPRSFTPKKPNLTTESVPETTITIDSVDPDMQQFFKAADASRIKSVIRLRAFNPADTSVPLERQPIEFTASNIGVKESQAQIRGTFADLKKKQFPSLLYTYARFPSLGR